MRYISATQLKDILKDFASKIKELKVDKQEAVLTLNDVEITDTGTSLSATGTGIDKALADSIIMFFNYDDAKAIFGI